jgi:hypothetical protein
MKQERRNKFIAFVAGALTTIGILFFTVERRHDDWHHECRQETGQETNNSSQNE